MPLRYFKTKKQIQKKNARNEKNLLEIREVGKKTCGKPTTFQREGGWAGGIGGGSKASLGLKRDKRLKTI